MIEKKWIGHQLPPSELLIERGRLQFFARSIGETDPMYTDLAAARAAGYPDLPAPPTFIFAAELESGAVTSLLETLELPIQKILHGEQGFTYLKPVCAGERVTVRSKIADIYEKKGGALEFVLKSSEVRNSSGELVAELRSLLVCRN